MDVVGVSAEGKCVSVCVRAQNRGDCHFSPVNIGTHCFKVLISLHLPPHALSVSRAR